MNARMVQAMFDDANTTTARWWAYDDTGVWNATRNVDEFVAAVPSYSQHGLNAVTVGMQGGSACEPDRSSSKVQCDDSHDARFWPSVSAFRADGALESAWIGRLGVPKEQPAWLTDEMLAYYLNAYRHSGFAGGINYYRNLDENWRRLLPLRESKITCPVLFIAGTADMVIQGMGADALHDMMAPRVPHLDIVMLPKIGHWLQNEAPEAVNEAMLRFLQQP